MAERRRLWPWALGLGMVACCGGTLVALGATAFAAAGGAFALGGAWSAALVALSLAASVAVLGTVWVRRRRGACARPGAQVGPEP